MPNCKRHKWDLGVESCHNCAYYEEYCRRKDCHATRLMNPQGKEVERNEY